MSEAPGLRWIRPRTPSTRKPRHVFLPAHRARRRPDPTRRWLTFTAAIAISAATRDWLAKKITIRRWKIRSRWRKLDPTTQATLILAFLRTNLTHAELRCRPNRCTRMVKAVLTVYYREHQPFAL